MLASEVRRIVGRRGSFWSALLIGFGAVVLLIIIRLTGKEDPGGTLMLDAMGPISLVATIMSVLVGALAGSYDTAQGTMRYLVMTGVPRRRLYANRVAGMVIATLIACAPAVVLGIAAAHVCRHGSLDDPRFTDDLGAVWAYVALPIVFGLVSLGVGSMLRSNGAAIGVALGFALGGTVLTGLAANFISETLAGYLLPAATPVVASLQGNDQISLGAAFVSVAVWLAAFLAVGLLRTLRDEY
jgi:ABC-type transport system involved in multi-copper enzyme maturation permease subunit